MTISDSPPNSAKVSNLAEKAKMIRIMTVMTQKTMDRLDNDQQLQINAQLKRKIVKQVVVRRSIQATRSINAGQKPESVECFTGALSMFSNLFSAMGSASVAEDAEMAENRKAHYIRRVQLALKLRQSASKLGKEADQKSAGSKAETQETSCGSELSSSDCEEDSFVGSI